MFSETTNMFAVSNKSSSEVLRRTNYDTWAQEMTLLLRSHDLWKITKIGMDPSIIEIPEIVDPDLDLYVDSVPLADHILDDSLSPEDSRELHLDVRASYLIIRSLDPANKLLISNCSMANQRWDALRTYHLGERNTQIALISAQLSRMLYTGKSSISLEDHMIKILDLNLKAKQLGYPRSNTEIAFQMLNSATDPKWANTIEALSLTSDPTVVLGIPSEAAARSEIGARTSLAAAHSENEIRTSLAAAHSEKWNEAFFGKRIEGLSDQETR